MRYGSRVAPDVYLNVVMLVKLRGSASRDNFSTTNVSIIKTDMLEEWLNLRFDNEPLSGCCLGSSHPER